MIIGNRPLLGLVALVVSVGCGHAKPGADAGGVADGNGVGAVVPNRSGGTTGSSKGTDLGAGGSGTSGVGGQAGGGTGGRADSGSGGTGGGGGAGAGAGGGAVGGGAKNDAGRGSDGPVGYLDANGNLGPAASLSGQRWTTPCLNPEKNNIVCDTPPVCPAGGFTSTMKVITFAGTADTTYDLRVRVRGVLEPKHYTGGVALGNHIYSGGQVGMTVYNIVSLAISAPAQTYYLNHDDNDRRGEQHYVNQVDQVFNIRIAAGATLTLRSHDPNCALIRNCMAETGPCVPYTFPDLPVPAGYDGQWAQIDVLSITP